LRFEISGLAARDQLPLALAIGQEEKIVLGFSPFSFEVEVSSFGFKV